MFNRHRDERLRKDFAEKITEQMDSIYNLALRMTRNRHDTEDLVQEACLKAQRFFHKFEAGTNFKSWVLTILRNIYINEYRRKSKEPPRVDFEAVKDFVSLPEVTEAREEAFSEAVTSSIERLPEELSTTLILFYTEEFSYKEIADIMNVPVGTVMSRLYTARQTLRKLLHASVKGNRY